MTRPNPVQHAAPTEVPGQLHEARSRSTTTPTRRRAGLLSRTALLLIWAVLVVVLAVTVPDQFLSPVTFSTIFGTQSVLVVLTLALLLPLTTGDFDLSVASTMGMSATLTVVISGDRLALPLPIALVAAIGVGLLVGAVNAALVVYAGVDAIVVTLGMATLLLGLANYVSDSIIQTGVSAALSDAVNSRFLLLPASFWYGILLAAVLWYVLALRPIGRQALFVGQNRDMARLTGIRVDRVRVGAFVGAGLLSAVAGVIMAGQLGAYQASSSAAYLLPTFAAAFLGTTAITPGRFNPWGSVIAIYFLITGVTGLNLLSLTGWVQDAFYGAALIVAVTVSTLVRRRNAR